MGFLCHVQPEVQQLVLRKSTSTVVVLNGYRSMHAHTGIHLACIYWSCYGPARTHAQPNPKSVKLIQLLLFMLNLLFRSDVVAAEVQIPLK